MTDVSTPPAPHRVLVTGAAGQDGYYLCEQLVAEGAVVFGLVHDENGSIADGVTEIRGDLRDAASLRRAVETAEPDEVYNLAAESFVPTSWGSQAEADDVNASGVERLAEAMRDCGANARLCHASSAEIFGAPTGRPQAEDEPLGPATPYGEAKARAHRFVARLRDEHGVFACSAILFNHESPRRQPAFVTRKITMAAARIARGIDRELVLGSLDASRDWGYAPEYMTAMRLMMRSGAASDYVVATGRAATVRDFVRLAFAHVGLDWERYVLSNQTLHRAGDTAARIGNAARIQRDLGWKATTSLEELIAIMVDSDVARLDRSIE